MSRGARWRESNPRAAGNVPADLPLNYSGRRA